MKLKGKVALITGAGSGIGRTTAILFAQEGAKVVVAGRTLSACEETVNIIKSEGGEATFIQADVSKVRDVKKMIENTIKYYRKLDILFNNAGEILKAMIIKTSVKEWERIINVNLKGVFLCCKYAIPIMVKQRSGVIINMASTFGFVGAPGYGAYCASKGGVIAFTKALALEVAPYNIRVNCICPGTIITPMVNRLWIASGKPDERRKNMLRKHPIKRLGRPEDVAYAALYLASDESSFVTGSALFIDGGYTAQ